MLSVINRIEQQSNLIESIINNQLKLYLNYFDTLISNLFNKYNAQFNPPSPSSPFSHSKLKINKVIKGKSGWVGSICLLRDGRLVSGNETGIKVYHQYTHQIDITIDEGYSVRSVCGLRNGHLASGDGNGDILIYEMGEDEYKLIQTLKGHSKRINKIIELEDGRLSSCSWDHRIIIWDTNYQPITTLYGHTHPVWSIVEMNHYIISSTDREYDDGVMIWNKKTYEFIQLIKDVYCRSRNGISKLAENKIILGGTKELFVLDVLSFKYKTFKDERIGEIRSILVLREDEILIGNNKGEIMCYDSISNQIIFTQSVHEGSVYSIIKTEDNQILSYSDDCNINIYG